MRLKKLLTAVAVSSLIATPALANEASSLSVAKAATSAKKSNKLSGTTIAVGLLATAAVVGGILAITDDNDDSDSN